MSFKEHFNNTCLNVLGDNAFSGCIPDAACQQEPSFLSPYLRLPIMCPSGEAAQGVPTSHSGRHK